MHTHSAAISPYTLIITTLLNIQVFECISSYKGSSKLDLALFLPSLFLYVMSLGSVDQIDSFLPYRTLIASLISKIEDKLNDDSLSYDPISADQSNMFNLIEYENCDFDNLDPNESINQRRLNLLSAHFLTNDSDFELTKKICFLFKKIAFKWPNLVKIKKYIFFNFQEF